MTDLIRLSANPFKDILIKSMIALVCICLLAPIELVVQEDLSITMQTLVILFFSILFGWQTALISIVGYIILGGLGLPVFSGHSSGFGVLQGASGGFFFGFLFAGVITGYLSGTKPFEHPLAQFMLWIIGHAIILLLGFMWFAKFNPEWKETLEFVAKGAVIKSAFGALILALLRRFLIGQRPSRHTKAFQD